MPSLFEILTGILLVTMQGIALVNQERIMSGLTDLQSAVAALQDFAKTVVAELAALQAATGDDDATVESLAEQVNASIATIKAALPPAPAPAPSAPTPSAAPSA